MRPRAPRLCVSRAAGRGPLANEPTPPEASPPAPREVWGSRLGERGPAEAARPCPRPSRTGPEEVDLDRRSQEKSQARPSPTLPRLKVSSPEPLADRGSRVESISTPFSGESRAKIRPRKICVDQSAQLIKEKIRFSDKLEVWCERKTGVKEMCVWPEHTDHRLRWESCNCCRF